MARSLENDAKLADARVDAQLATFDQLKSQAATTNEQDVQLRALEREAKSQRDLLESYLAKYREASARDTIDSAPPDARIISRATVSNVPAYPKKLPTVLIASLATFVLMCGMVVTRELLDAPGAVAFGMPLGRGRRKDAASAGEAPTAADTDGDIEPELPFAAAARPFAPFAPAAKGRAAREARRDRAGRVATAPGPRTPDIRTCGPSARRSERADQECPHQEPPTKSAPTIPARSARGCAP